MTRAAAVAFSVLCSWDFLAFDGEYARLALGLLTAVERSFT